MKSTDYQTLLALLDSAKLLLTKNAGELSAADLRIGCLVNITGAEARRALLELDSLGLVDRTAPAGEGDGKEKTTAPRVQRNRANAVHTR